MNQSTLKTIKNTFDEKKNSHAFLVETNNVDDCLNEILNLIAAINGIDKNNFIKENIPDIKIVKPEGKDIKRSQITQILEEFQTYPVVLKHRYYIIVESELMNQSSSNTILKFLEEPDGDIIGFFITNNKKAMISTIMSRCQHYKLLYDCNININIDKVKDFLLNMSNIEIYKKIIFLNNYISKDRLDNIKKLKEIKDYLLNIEKNDNINQIKLLVKRVRLLDNVIERLLKNANQELVILDLAKNWK